MGGGTSVGSFATLATSVKGGGSAWTAGNGKTNAETNIVRQKNLMVFISVSPFIYKPVFKS
jgi:hypothetical protein